jgi:hypothetical protein
MFLNQLSSRERNARILSLFGAVLLVAGSFAPVVQGEILSTGWSTMFTPGDHQNYSAFGYAAHGAVIGLAILNLVLTFTASYRLLLLVGCAAAFALIRSLQQCLRMTVGDSMSSNWFLWQDVLGWGWLPLIMGAFCILAAALVAEPPQDWMPEMINTAKASPPVSIGPVANNTPRPLPKDFGPCTECGTNNAHIATKCHQCGAMLPWVKIKPQRVKAGTILPKASTQAAPRRSLDFGAFVMGFFCLIMPIVGYFVYRSYAEKGSERTAVAGWCTLVGFGLVGLRILARLADVVVP